MSKLLRTIGAGIALPLTVLFTTSASEPAAGIPTPAQVDVSISVPESIPLRPAIVSDKEKVFSAAQDFRDNFASRVKRNDYAQKWNACFSTKYGSQEYAYDPAVVRGLRRPVKNYKAALETIIGKPENTGYSSINYFQNTPSPDEISEPKKDIVVLDLGHGHEARLAEAGYDTGTIYNFRKAGELRETTVIDRISVSLRKKLEQNYDAIVVTTRGPISEGITLKNRNSKFSNQPTALQVRSELSMYLSEKFPYHRVIFVSLHGNYGSDTGAEIYYYAPWKGGATDSPASRNLAKSIAANFRLHAGSRTPTISNDYAVLRCQTNPAVLVEMGYLQNANDRVALAQTDRVSSQLAKGIDAYLKGSRVEKPFGPNITIALNTP